jgi:hypothetical protein
VPIRRTNTIVQGQEGKKQDVPIEELVLPLIPSIIRRIEPSMLTMNASEQNSIEKPTRNKPGLIAESIIDKKR